MRLEEGEQMSLRPNEIARKKDILPRIFLKVSSRHVTLEVTSVSRLMSHGHSPGTIRDILEQERTCLYVPRLSSFYIHACTLPLSYHVHTSHAGECRASGNVWVPSTVWWMRRVWRNVIGTDTRGSALARFSLPSLFLIHTSWRTPRLILPEKAAPSRFRGEAYRFRSAVFAKCMQHSPMGFSRPI